MEPKQDESDYEPPETVEVEEVKGLLTVAESGEEQM